MNCFLFIWALFALHCHSTLLPAPKGEDLAISFTFQSSSKLTRQNDYTHDGQTPFRLASASEPEINKARAIVDAAIREITVRNKARLERTFQNKYIFRSHTKGRTTDEVTPLFDVTDEIAKAAALLAEADAYENLKNGARKPIEKRKRASQFWMANISHRGSWPFGNNDPNYLVFRDVTAYGAKGDGVTDDTEAIRRAVSDFKACGPACYSSTTKGAIIYFPPGEYLVSGTIETYYGTQFIGDPLDRPVIKAAPSFVGLGVISTNHYVENGKGKQWFITTANFYRQIRNFIIDITDTNQQAYIAALHYQVAQATSLQFIEFRVSTAPGTTQQAIFAENGSGGFMSDLVFNGGAFGIYGGSQQFTSQRLTFNGCRTAVQLIWDWGWVWKSVNVKNAGIGFKLLSENGVHNTGSIMIVDSVFDNTETAVLTFPASLGTGDGTTGVTLDNVKFVNVQKGVADNNGKVYLDGRGTVDTWVLGPIYIDQRKQNVLSAHFNARRNPTMLGENRMGLPQAPYFERSKPQYETIPASQFVNTKDYCAGDGVKDDTACFQGVLDRFGSSRIIYVNAGSYILTNTITIPNNARVVGENWAQLVAYGPKFQDATNPRALIQVGNVGQRGAVEMQDLLFTSKGPTAGVIFVQWNLKSDGPGKAGMWDCHVRVGGAVGTELTANECPPRTSGINERCNAGSALMHITPNASGYFENVWLWVADHDIDDPDLVNDENPMIQTSVYVARGLLAESTSATWLYGTSSEHAVFYQYEFYGAKNLLAGMIQTESPYYQPTPRPPEPFRNAVGVMPGDPTYRCTNGEPCDASWALRILNSSEITVHGAGLYSWFQTYTQECVATMNCQNTLVQLENNHGNVNIYNLVTIGAVNMINSDGTRVGARDNLAVNFNPYWSLIAVYDPRETTSVS